MITNKIHSFILLILISLLGCSKDNNTTEAPNIYPVESPAYDLFGISKSITLIRQGRYKLDEKEIIVFMGKDASKNNNAWVGLYEVNSKSKLMEFTDNESWPKEVENENGNLYPIFNNEVGAVFHLVSNIYFNINYDSPNNALPAGFSRLYIVKDNKITTKLDGKLQNNEGYITIVNFRKYLNGFILTKKHNNSLSYDYYDHTLTQKFNSDILALNPISFDEEMVFDNNTFSAKKINLKTNTILFEKKIDVEGLVYGNDNNTTKEVTQNEWIISNKWKETVKNGGTTFEYYYTNKYSINIITGDIKVITKKLKI